MDVPLLGTVSNWLLLVVILLLTIYIFFTWRFSELKGLGIQGPRPYPILGNFHLLVKHGIYELDTILAKTYGKVFSFYEGRTPTIVCGDIKVLRQVLVKDFGNFINRRPLLFRGILKEGLFDAESDKWKRLRTHLTPAFSTGKLKQMLPQVKECGELLLEAVGEKMKKGQPFEAKTVAAAFTMDVIARTVFGLEINTQKNPDNPFNNNALKLFQTSMTNPYIIVQLLFPFLAPAMEKLGFESSVPEECDTFFRNILTQLLDARRNNEEKHNDFVQMMLNSEKDLADDNTAGSDEISDTKADSARKGLSSTEILAQCFLFFVAGYETTGTTLGFTLYNLATNQEAQDKLITEINDVMGDEDDVTYEMLPKMPYLDMVIHETLRIFPPVPRLDRRAANDINCNGCIIPKDMIVVYPIRMLHMNPDVYPEPEKFEPERFSAEEKAMRDPFYFMPFGMGPRQCIGMRLAMLELKLVLVMLLRQYKILSCDKTEVPVQLEKYFFPAAKNGLWVKPEPRS